MTRSDRYNTNHSFFCSIIAAAVVVLFATIGWADSIRIQKRAEVSGRTVTLQDIAALEGDHAAALGNVVITGLRGKDTTVSLPQIRQRLSDAGANWAMLSLRGYARCEIQHVAAAEEIAVSDDAAAVANVEQPIDVRSAVTLRDKLLALLADRAGVPQDDLRVTYSDHDAALIHRDALTARFELEPTVSGVLGRVPVTIRRYEAGRVAETFTVAPTVQRRVLAVVATSGISRGQTLLPGDVQVREVYLDASRGEPVLDPSDVIGQQAAGVLREGAVIYRDDVRLPVLVKRGELITVRCMAGNLVVRTVARALEDGGADQMIRVRNEASRETYAVTVTGRREASVITGNASTRETIASAEGGNS